MGVSWALEALTNPNPSDRQLLIQFIAERCLRRFKGQPNDSDVWYMITVLVRWGYISGEDIPKFSRRTLGTLVGDCTSAWHMLKQENV